MGRHIDTDHTLHIIFHVDIEQGRTDRRALVNSILQVEVFASAAKVQGIMHSLHKIHLIISKYLLLLQDPVKAVVIDRVVSRLVVYKDATFILIFLERSQALGVKDNVYACAHACRKASLVAV
jgi:hypothetical protein